MGPVKDLSAQNHSENPVFPFLWMKGQSKEKLSEQILQIRDAGIRAFCVEARPHPDFCGDGWWQDMDFVLKVSKENNMQVWIFDDDHYPTGHANGAIEKNPDLRPIGVAETHVDIMGPFKGTIRTKKFLPEDCYIGVVACKRTANNLYSPSQTIDFSTCRKDDWVEVDLPQGCWRVFSLLLTRHKTDFYIDMLNPNSVDALISAVYEPHWEHYQKEFGSVIAGFFSDEPGFRNKEVEKHGNFIGTYNNRLGIPGLGFPWSKRVFELLTENGHNVICRLPALWYSFGKKGKEFRVDYMDAVSAQYSENFTTRLGDWCRAHGVQYIGHVIEDNGNHARLGSGAGHYFRAMKGQSMSGIDIVLHQVVPGFAHFNHGSSCEIKTTDAEFFHYILGQLAASDASLDPVKNGKSFCEVFGAYGWQEDVPMMKWLIDFLLVRGINHFIPHAFSPVFPDPDCPPHFGADGKDPQFEGFSVLMRYLDKMSNTLSGSKREVHAAILYHAEEEWANEFQYIPMQKIGKILYDHHVCYDILPIDLLENATVQNGSICIREMSYSCLFVGTADYFPKKVASVLDRLKAEGANIQTVLGGGKLSHGGTLLEYLQRHPLSDISVSGKAPLLRHLSWQQGQKKYSFFFNESITDPADVAVTLPWKTNWQTLHLLCCESPAPEQFSGDSVHLQLHPYESVLFVSTDEMSACNQTKQTKKQEICLHPTYNISLASYQTPGEFRFLRSTDQLFNITAISEQPDFSGWMRYEWEFAPQEGAKILLNLGKVGSVAHLRVNGIDCGTCICPPYSFDITDALRNATNQICVEVANTLANAIPNRHSYPLPIEQSGLMGPVTLTVMH